MRKSIGPKKDYDKEQAVLDTIRSRFAAEQKVTFYAIEKATGVSKSYLYKNKKISSLIKELRSRPILTAEEKIEKLQQENRQLKDRIKELEKAEELRHD